MPPKTNSVNELPSRPRVLVVDDSTGMRIYLRTILSGAGYDVVEAPDGGAAFDQVLANKFDLVFADLALSQMDGYALLSAISLLPKSRGRPAVVVCSALLQPDVVGRRQELKLAAVLLAKPVQPEDVLKAAEKALKTLAQC